MRKLNMVRFIAFLFVALTSGGALTYAATAVNLGTADSFAVLAGSDITNTGSTVVNGDLGLSPGSAITGFLPGIVNGIQHVNDAAAAGAQSSLTSAYNDIASRVATTLVTTDLGGLTLAPGVYSDNGAPASLSITGTLTLDAGGDPDAVFIFQSASTLVTADNSNIILINGARACNVSWQVTSSATLGTNSEFKGNILALTSITLDTGANVEGRILARNGAVTLDSNTINRATCPTHQGGGGSISFIPIPAPAQSATLRLMKIVINDDGGAKTISDFPLFVNATSVTSGDITVLSPGTYTASETNTSGYAAGLWGGDCNSNGSVTLGNGDNKTCTITNNDIASYPVSNPITPPLITITPLLPSAGTPIVSPIITNTPLIPLLPNAGIAPQNHSTPWSSIILVGIITTLSLVITRRKKVV